MGLLRKAVIPMRSSISSISFLESNFVFPLELLPIRPEATTSSTVMEIGCLCCFLRQVTHINEDTGSPCLKKEIRPLVGLCNLRIVRSNDVFPPPLGPVIKKKIALINIQIYIFEIFLSV